MSKVSKQSPEQENQRQATASSSILNVFTVCSALTDLTENNINVSCSQAVVKCHKTLFDEFDDVRSLMDDSKEEDEEEMQVRRLTSWATIGTNGTIGTHTSEHGTRTVGNENIDDFGNPIDPKILEMTITTRDKRISGRKRLVKFDYPPISQLRECPRADPSNLSKLFFTEEELDMYEHDRESTYNADDIEIVANSSSLSEDEQDILPDGSTTPSNSEYQQRFGASNGSVTPQGAGAAFGNYVSTPRMWNKGSRTQTSSRPSALTAAASPTAIPQATFFEDQASSPRGRPSGDKTTAAKPKRRPTPGPHGRRKREEPERLLKSVQIFLRERSTCRN